MNQAYALLRAKCTYCHRLKMARVDVNHYTCKLRLLQHGLILQSNELEGLNPKSKALTTKSGPQGQQENDPSSDESEDDLDPESLIQVKTAFVNKAIKESRRLAIGNGRPRERNETMVRQRRAVVKDFLSSLHKGRRCSNCGG